MRIRRARREDADFLAWVMLAASRAHLTRGVWDLIIGTDIGTDEEGCLDYLKRLAVAEPRSLYHYENFVVAEVDGTPAAGLCSFDMREDTWAIVAEATSAVQHDIGWSEADVAASRERVAPVWACFLKDAGADWGIENVGTRPEYRGRGLASALMAEFLREGAERGRQLAQITTYIGNDAARSVYEKAGFRFSDEKRCAEVAALLGAPGFMRFLRKLQK